MTSQKQAKRWLPLEANPDVMNQVPSSSSSLVVATPKSIHLSFDLASCLLGFLGKEEAICESLLFLWEEETFDHGQTVSVIFHRG